MAPRKSTQNGVLFTCMHSYHPWQCCFSLWEQWGLDHKRRGGVWEIDLGWWGFGSGPFVVTPVNACPKSL